MKITGVTTYVLEELLEDKAFGWSQWVTDRRQTALCVISTDEGIDGVGEAMYIGGPAKIAATMLNEAYAPLLAGADPFQSSVIWANITGIDARHVRPRLLQDGQR